MFVINLGADFSIQIVSRRSSRQKIKKKPSELLHMLKEMDYRVFHSTTMQYTFFSAAHKNFSR
jgi:hypothetical protein